MGRSMAGTYGWTSNESEVQTSFAERYGWVRSAKSSNNDNWKCVECGSDLELQRDAPAYECDRCLNTREE